MYLLVGIGTDDDWEGSTLMSSLLGISVHGRVQNHNTPLTLACMYSTRPLQLNLINQTIHSICDYCTPRCIVHIIIALSECGLCSQLGSYFYNDTSTQRRLILEELLKESNGRRWQVRPPFHQSQRQTLSSNESCELGLFVVEDIVILQNSCKGLDCWS